MTGACREPDQTTAAARRLVERSTSAQNLPFHVADVATVRSVATIVGAAAGVGGNPRKPNRLHAESRPARSAGGKP